MTEPVATLVARAVDGDRFALARALSLVESGGDDARRVLAALPRSVGTPAPVVGITGAPGAGKSTLTGALVAWWRHEAPDESVAVLAVDPSSPFSGGAILGDRIRMVGHETDTGVYIRSMASRGHLGGLARAAPQAVRVLDASGFRRIVVETVGVGQSEVGVAAAADTTVVVLNPGWGDQVQAGKAGLLEIADVLVVNKADRPGVDATVRDLELVLERSERPWRTPIVPTIATDRTGVEELAAAIDDHHVSSADGPRERQERRIRDEVRALVLETLARQVDERCAGPAFDSVVARVAAGELDPYTAASDLLAPER